MGTDVTFHLTSPHWVDEPPRQQQVRSVLASRGFAPNQFPRYGADREPLTDVVSLSSFARWLPAQAGPGGVERADRWPHIRSEMENLLDVLDELAADGHDDVEAYYWSDADDLVSVEDMRTDPQRPLVNRALVDAMESLYGQHPTAEA